MNQKKTSDALMYMKYIQQSLCNQCNKHTEEEGGSCFFFHKGSSNDLIQDTISYIHLKYLFKYKVIYTVQYCIQLAVKTKTTRP